MADHLGQVSSRLEHVRAGYVGEHPGMLPSRPGVANLCFRAFNGFWCNKLKVYETDKNADNFVFFSSKRDILINQVWIK